MANFREIARNGMKVREMQKKFFAHYKSPLVKKLSQILPEIFQSHFHILNLAQIFTHAADR